MSDYDNDQELHFDNEYIGEGESFDDADTGAEERPNSLESSASEVDQVAALLMGQDPGEVSEGKNTSPFRTHNIDKNTDKPELGSQEAPQQQPQQQLRGDHGDFITKDQLERGQEAYAYAQRLADAESRLKEMHANGSISTEEASANWQILAAEHQKATMAMQQAELDGYKRREQMAREQRIMVDRLGDRFDTPEKQSEVLTGLQDWAREKGIADDIHSIDDGHTASLVLESYMNERDLIETKQKLAVAQQKIRENNRRNKGRQAKAAKDNRIGARSEDTIDQVARILGGLK